MRIALLIPDNRDESRRFDDPAPVFGPAPAALLEGLAEMPDCEIQVLACTHRPMAAPPKLAGNIFFHLLPVPAWGWTRGLFVGCALAIRKKLRELQPQLVHGQGTERYCALAAVCSGFPNLLTLHGNMRHLAALVNARPFSHLWLAARIEGLAVRRTGGVICLTNHTRRAVEASVSRTWLVPNAVDATFFEVTPNPSEEPVLLCAGDILPWKNQLGLLRALDPLATELRFKLVCCGKLNEREAYGREFLEMTRTRPWCQHAGHMSKPELQAALSQASVLVLPSREENCPMVVLEAMAAGLPVAASRTGGLPDLVEEEMTGLLFDPENPADICRSVGRILRDRALRQEMGVRARSVARRRFHPRVVAGQHLEIYRQMLGSHRPAAS